MNIFIFTLFPKTDLFSLHLVTTHTLLGVIHRQNQKYLFRKQFFKPFSSGNRDLVTNLISLVAGTCSSLRPSRATSNSRWLKLSMRNMQLSTRLFQSALEWLLTETRSTSHASFPLCYFTKCLSGAQPGALSKNVLQEGSKIKLISLQLDSTYVPRQNTTPRHMQTTENSLCQSSIYLDFNRLLIYTQVSTICS